MKNKIVIMILIVVLAIVLGGATLLYNFLGERVETNRLSVEQNTEFESDNADRGGQDRSEQKLTKAPDFTVYDESGNAFQLSDFEGKPVVLNFWASWCGPCKSEMPEFEAAYNEYGEEVYFLMVNMTDGYQETVDSAKKFIMEKGYGFPVYYDNDMEAAKAYSVYSIPTTYFLDQNGYIIAQGRGALDAETLQQGIDYIYE